MSADASSGGDKHTSPSSTYAGQASLPRLPVPSLEETLDRFPAAVCALLDDGSSSPSSDDDVANTNGNGSSSKNGSSKEMEECHQAIQKFLTTDGPILQKLLVEYDQEGKEDGTVGSYVEEFWSDAYLAPDSSVVMNLNPFFVLEVCGNFCSFFVVQCSPHSCIF